jgi:hypothetical protein
MGSMGFMGSMGMYTLSDLQERGVLDENGKLSDYPFYDDKDVIISVIRDILRRLNSIDFQLNPHIYISALEAERGPTQELRIPFDLSIAIIKKYYMR